MSQIENAYAKINLFLHVTGQRADGYHLLQSLAVFANLHDKISLEDTASTEDQLKLSGNFGQLLKTNDPNNLILKAIAAFRETVSDKAIPFQAAHLEKNLPVAGGIGGGSADAAAALRILQNIYGHQDKDLLYKAALKLGADVPVCLKSHAAVMEGIGEKLTEVKIPKFGIILANPGVSVSTPTIFKALAKQRAEKHGVFTPSKKINEIAQNWDDTLDSKKAFLEFIKNTHNDLQPPAVTEEPVIGEMLETLEKLNNVLFVRMSGSGGTCFALFEDQSAAQKACKQFKELSSSKEWWVEAGEIATHF